MPTPAAAAFLTDLEECQLLPAARLGEARRLAERLGPEARALARELIDRGWLTPFQANQLLQGRGRTLVLGPYVLLERVGRGGMGEVFKARHQLMDRVVAVKVLRAERLGDHDALARFWREVQAAARLVHPNVVLAHDANHIGDTYFLVLEFVEGTDLARLLGQRGRLPAAEACAYVREAALGLQHAHERGLVHRDVKPSNLLLARREGVIKVLDLGLARLRSAADGGRLTQEGSVMGTADYIAPEQAVDSARADPRADVYSLGCTLYHLLAGRPPFPGGSLTEKLLRHQRDEPEALERLCPELSAGLGGVVRQMMAKRPEDRYQTAGAVAAALAPFAGDVVPVEADGDAPPAAPQTLTKTISWAPDGGSTAAVRARRRLLLALAAGGMFVLAVVACILVGAAVHRARHRGGEQAAGAGVPRAPEKQIARDKARGRKSPPKEPEKAGPPSGRPDKLTQDLRAHTAGVQCLAFSPDGKTLASGGDDHCVRLWDTRTGKEAPVSFRHAEAVTALAWSADGKRLASAGWDGGAKGVVRVWDVPGGRQWKQFLLAERTVPSDSRVRGLAFSPDGKLLAAVGGPVRVWDLQGGRGLAIFAWQTRWPSGACGVTFTPDGKVVAAGCYEAGADSVRLWRLPDLKELPPLQVNNRAAGLSDWGGPGALLFAPGGRLLARVTGRMQPGQLGKPAGTAPPAGAKFPGPWAIQPGRPVGTLTLWDFEPAEKRFDWRDNHPTPGGAVFALAALPGGRFRVAAAGRGGPGSPFPPGTDARMWDSADPRRTEVRLWDSDEPRREHLLTTGHRLDVLSLALSADGRLLATGSADTRVKIWEAGR
jgi:serine/threonine-protein kinase